MKHFKTFTGVLLAASALMSVSAGAVELNIVHGAIGKDNEVLRKELDR